MRTITIDEIDYIVTDEPENTICQSNEDELFDRCFFVGYGYRKDSNETVQIYFYFNMDEVSSSDELDELDWEGCKKVVFVIGPREY